MAKIEDNSQNPLLKETLKYISLGFSVIPLGSITKDSSGTKVIEYPNGWKRYQNTIATEEEIKTWNYINLGIATGKISNLLVLDTDSYKENFDIELIKSFNLPITPTQQTASGGKQYFFKYPEKIILKNATGIGRKDSGIDIRGDGGMVICPPSKTPYGEYKWLISPVDEPLAEIPPKLLELLTQQSSDELKPRKTLPELVGLKQGEGRNNAMASFIGKLLLSIPQDRWDSEVWPMALEVNNTYKPPMTKEEITGIYNSITKIESDRRNKEVNKTEKSPYIPSVSHSELINQEFPPVRFTLEPFFEQGTMNMLSAPPNTWKSWLLFYFAGHIVNGTSALNKFPTLKANIMIVNEEDSARLIQDRLKLLSITDTSLNIFYRIAHGSKLEENFVNSLIKEAKEKDIGVIMFDSLRSIHEAEENSSTEMQKVMDLLKKIARENITVIFTHHHRKKSMFGGKNENSESSRGSSAVNAAVSGHISLEEVEREDGRVLIVYHLKSKVGEKEKPFEILIHNGDGKISFDYGGDHKPKEEALSAAKERIISELENRKELMGRKDFVYLKLGGATALKAATISLEKEVEQRVKVMLRKEAEKKNLKTFSTGKPNEKLYYIQNEKILGQEDFDNLT